MSVMTDQSPARRHLFEYVEAFMGGQTITVDQLTLRRVGAAIELTREGVTRVLTVDEFEAAISTAED